MPNQKVFLYYVFECLKNISNAHQAMQLFDLK